MEKKLQPRKTKEEEGIGLFSLLKYLLLSYLCTGLALMALAFVLYRFRLSGQVVSIVIIVIYVAATFLAGFLAGRKAGSRRFLWGLLEGSAYFLVLALLSLAIYHSVGDLTHSFLTTLLLCACGGMSGGMFGGSR